MTLCIGAFLAFAMEWQQRFIPGRSFNINDLWLNILGVIMGILFGFLWRKHIGSTIKLLKLRKKKQMI